MRLAFFLLVGYPLCAVPCLRVRRALVRSCVRLCFPAAFLSQQLKRHDKQSPAVCVGCANGRGGECEQCGAYHSLTGAHKTLPTQFFFCSPLAAERGHTSTSTTRTAHTPRTTRMLAVRTRTTPMEYRLPRHTAYTPISQRCACAHAEHLSHLCAVPGGGHAPKY